MEGSDSVISMTTFLSQPVSPLIRIVDTIPDMPHPGFVLGHSSPGVTAHSNRATLQVHAMAAVVWRWDIALSKERGVKAPFSCSLSSYSSKCLTGAAHSAAACGLSTSPHECSATVRYLV